MRNINRVRLPNLFVFEHVVEFLHQGKSVIIMVKGHSMLPFLREGERIVLHSFKKKEVRKGTIVLAKQGSSMLLHRVVKLRKDEIWLAGDSNLVQKEVVKWAEVVAIARSVHRGNTEVNLTSKWSKGMGLLWYFMRPLRRMVERIR